MATLSYIQSLIISMKLSERIKPPIFIKNLNNFSLPQWSLFYRGDGSDKFSVRTIVLNPLKQDEYFENPQPRDTSPYDDVYYAGTFDNESAEKIGKTRLFSDSNDPSYGISVRKYLDEQLLLFNEVLKYKVDKRSQFSYLTNGIEFPYTRTTISTDYNEAGEVTDETTTTTTGTKSSYVSLSSGKDINISAGVSGNYINNITTDEMSFGVVYDDADKNLFYLDKLRYFNQIRYSGGVQSKFDYGYQDIFMTTPTLSSTATIEIPADNPLADLSSTGIFLSTNAVYRSVAKINNYTWAELKAEYPKPNSWI